MLLLSNISSGYGPGTEKGWRHNRDRHYFYKKAPAYDKRKCLIIVVPREGIEPTRPEGHWILSGCICNILIIMQFGCNVLCPNEIERLMRLDDM